MAKMNSPRSVNKAVALEAHPAIFRQAVGIASKAAVLLSSHHRSGEHEITLKNGRVDCQVSLVGPAALSIENGHFSGYKGERKFVEGLHILKRASGLR